MTASVVQLLTRVTCGLISDMSYVSPRREIDLHSTMWKGINAQLLCNTDAADMLL